MEVTYGLRLPSEAASVSIVRSLCRTTMGSLGVQQLCIDDLLLALTEACANVVEHSGDGDYDVRIDIDASRCSIEVIDCGSGFDPGAVDDRLPDPADERGRGLALIGLLTDDVHLDSVPGVGTSVIFSKRVDLLSASPLTTLPS